MEIQREDDANKFEDDAAAMNFVLEQASNGDKLALKALFLINSSLEEELSLPSFLEDASTNKPGVPETTDPETKSDKTEEAPVYYTILFVKDNAIARLGSYQTEDEAADAAVEAQTQRMFDVNDQSVYIVFPDHRIVEFGVDELVNPGKFPGKFVYAVCSRRLSREDDKILAVYKKNTSAQKHADNVNDICKRSGNSSTIYVQRMEVRE
jgi:hypothetical protein